MARPRQHYGEGLKVSARKTAHAKEPGNDQPPVPSKWPCKVQAMLIPGGLAMGRWRAKPDSCRGVDLL